MSSTEFTAMSPDLQNALADELPVGHLDIEVLAKHIDSLGHANNAVYVKYFERARIAHILGFPNTALLALQNFRILVGDHRTIRRLNTGVFAAQMAVTIGDEARALHVIRAVPARFLGKRPLALFGRLLINAGELEEARTVLSDHVSRASDNEDALLLLDEVMQRLGETTAPTAQAGETWFDMPREVTAEVLIQDGPLLDETGARLTPGPIPRRSARDPKAESD